MMNGISRHTWRRIRYQERDDGKKWGRIHISLDEAEYELFLDLRRMYKMSLSLLLAVGVKKHLSKIIKKLRCLASTDNYRITSYVICSSKDNTGLQSWKIYWGLPEFIPDTEYP